MSRVAVIAHLVEVRARGLVADGREALAVRRVAEVEAVARVASKIFEGVSSRDDGESLERLRLRLDASFGREHAEDVVFERQRERRIAVSQADAYLRAAFVAVRT